MGEQAEVRSLTVRDAIAQLTFAASRLPAGLDSEFKVAMCHGEGQEGEITSHVEIDHWSDIDKRTLRPQRSYVIAQGHPHRDPKGGTLKPWVPPDLGDGPAD
jgi:hypothetical protein